MVRVLAYGTEGPGFNFRPCLKLLKCKIELCIQNNNNNNNNNSHHLLDWRWHFSQKQLLLLCHSFAKKPVKSYAGVNEMKFWAAMRHSTLIEPVSRVILRCLESGIPDKYQHIQTGVDFDINPNKWTNEQETEQSKRVFTKRDRWTQGRPGA